METSPAQDIPVVQPLHHYVTLDIDLQLTDKNNVTAPHTTLSRTIDSYPVRRPIDTTAIMENRVNHQFLGVIDPRKHGSLEQRQEALADPIRGERAYLLQIPADQMLSHEGGDPHTWNSIRHGPYRKLLYVLNYIAHASNETLVDPHQQDVQDALGGGGGDMKLNETHVVLQEVVSLPAPGTTHQEMWGYHYWLITTSKNHSGFREQLHSLLQRMRELRDQHEQVSLGGHEALKALVNQRSEDQDEDQDDGNDNNNGNNNNNNNNNGNRRRNRSRRNDPASHHNDEDPVEKWYQCLPANDQVLYKELGDICSEGDLLAYAIMPVLGKAIREANPQKYRNKVTTFANNLLEDFVRSAGDDYDAQYQLLLNEFSVLESLSGQRVLTKHPHNCINIAKHLKQVDTYYLPVEEENSDPHEALFGEDNPNVAPPLDEDDVPSSSSPRRVPSNNDDQEARRYFDISFNQYRLSLATEKARRMAQIDAEMASGEDNNEMERADVDPDSFFEHSALYGIDTCILPASVFRQLLFPHIYHNHIYKKRLEIEKQKKRLAHYAEKIREKLKEQVEKHMERKHDPSKHLDLPKLIYDDESGSVLTQLGQLLNDSEYDINSLLVNPLVNELLDQISSEVEAPRRKMNNARQRIASAYKDIEMQKHNLSDANRTRYTEGFSGISVDVHPMDPVFAPMDDLIALRITVKDQQTMLRSRFTKKDGKISNQKEYNRQSKQLQEALMEEFENVWKTSNKVNDGVRAAREYMQNLPPSQQWEQLESLNTYENLSPFANLMLHFQREADEFLLVNTGFSTLILLLMTVYAANQHTYGIQVNVLNSGPTSASKSWLAEKAEELTIPKTTQEPDHSSTRSHNVHGILSGVCDIVHEIHGSKIGVGPRGEDIPADEQFKSRLAKPCIITTLPESNEKKKGGDGEGGGEKKRRQEKLLCLAQKTNIMNTNMTLPFNCAIRNRCIVLNAQKQKRHYMSGSDLIHQGARDDLKDKVANMRNNYLRIHMYVILVNNAITAGVLQDVCLKRWVHRWSSLFNHMSQKYGTAYPEPRLLTMMTNIVRQLCIFYAVNMCFFSPWGEEFRTGEDGSSSKFSISTMLPQVQKWLVVTDEISVFCLSMFSEQLVPSFPQRIARAVADSLGILDPNGRVVFEKLQTHYKKELMTEPYDREHRSQSASFVTSNKRTSLSIAAAVPGGEQKISRRRGVQAQITRDEAASHAVMEGVNNGVDPTALRPNRHRFSVTSSSTHHLRHIVNSHYEGGQISHNDLFSFLQCMKNVLIIKTRPLKPDPKDPKLAVRRSKADPESDGNRTIPMSAMQEDVDPESGEKRWSFPVELAAMDTTQLLQQSLKDTLKMEAHPDEWHFLTVFPVRVSENEQVNVPLYEWFDTIVVEPRRRPDESAGGGGKMLHASRGTSIHHKLRKPMRDANNRNLINANQLRFDENKQEYLDRNEGLQPTYREDVTQTFKEYFDLCSIPWNDADSKTQALLPWETSRYMEKSLPDLIQQGRERAFDETLDDQDKPFELFNYPQNQICMTYWLRAQSYMIDHNRQLSVEEKARKNEFDAQALLAKRAMYEYLARKHKHYITAKREWREKDLLEKIEDIEKRQLPKMTRLIKQQLPPIPPPVRHLPRDMTPAEEKKQMRERKRLKRLHSEQKLVTERVEAKKLRLEKYHNELKDLSDHHRRSTEFFAKLKDIREAMKQARESGDAEALNEARRAQQEIVAKKDDFYQKVYPVGLSYELCGKYAHLAKRVKVPVFKPYVWDPMISTPAAAVTIEDVTAEEEDNGGGLLAAYDI